MPEDPHSYSHQSEEQSHPHETGAGARPSAALSVGAAAACKRIGALVLTLSVIGWLVAVADAATQARRKHAINLTIVENQISTTNPNPGGPPPVGTTTVRAGVASITPGGSGADVDHVTVTSLSLSTRSATFKGRVTFFLLTGTLSGKSVGRVILHMDGSLTFSGATVLTSGTGAYKGLTGHLTFTGGSPNKPGSVTTIHLTGTATY